MRQLRSIALVSALALLAGLGLGLSSCSKSAKADKKQSYEFTTLGKGSIESVVSSSGTLSVVSSVGVLAEMSGRIEKVNVDYNNTVKKGQVLATINTDLLKLQAKAAPGLGRQVPGELRSSGPRGSKREDALQQGPSVRLRPQERAIDPRRRQGGARFRQGLPRADRDRDQSVRDHHLADRRHRPRAGHRRGPERGRRLVVLVDEPLSRSPAISRRCRSRPRSTSST